MQNATHRLTLAVALAALAVACLALGTQFAAAHGAGPNSVSLSAIPSVVSYQGRVLNGGNPVNGSAFFKFAIVNASGSSSFWSNDGSSVAGSEPGAGVPLMVTNGLFTVLLGDPGFSGMTLPLGAAVFSDGDRRLRVWFSSTGIGYTQLSPDERIAAVPFALNAQTLDGLDASAFAPSSHTHSAADITSGTLADARLSSNVVLGGQNVSRLANDAGYLTSAAGFISQSQADVRYARLQPNPQQLALLKWFTAFSGTQADFGISCPHSLAFDGANMWVSNCTSKVSVLRASDGFYVMTPTVANVGEDMAFDGANMWVTNFISNSLTVLRASNGVRVMTPTVGSSQFGIAFDGANMWIANYLSNTVSVLRASDGFHVMTPTVGARPLGLAFDGTNMWVANSLSNTVSVLRASDGFHVMTLTVGANPNHIAFDGANMWVATNAGSLSVLRASDGFRVMTPTIGVPAYNIAFDGANMWVANTSGNTVSVLRASDGSLLKNVPTGAMQVGIAFDGANMWVANNSSATVSKR